MPSLRHRAAHFVLKKLGFFSRSYREDHFGRVFTIPIVNGRKTYISEPWMADIIGRLFALKAGGFVDVGVNLGQTLLKVAAVDASREYVGFEPNPACVDYAWRLIRDNALPYRVFPVGLSDATKIETLYLFRSEDTDPSASMIEQFRRGTVSTRSVVTFRIDDLPRDALPDVLSIIKIDVEGGESFVIKGLERVLVTKRPYVLVEILPASNEGRLGRQREIETIVDQVGYAIYRIRLDSVSALSGIERLTSIGLVDDLALSDYLLVPDEEVKALEQALPLFGGGV